MYIQRLEVIETLSFSGTLRIQHLFYLAVDIFRVATKNGKMTAPVIQGGLPVDLLAIPEERPFPALTSTIITIMRIVNDLPHDQLAYLSYYNLVEHLVHFLESDIPELVQEPPFGFQWLMRISLLMTTFG
jgi:hypothetical protein